jgi:hypothetical protein
VDAATPRTQTRWKLSALSCPISHNRCQPNLQQTEIGAVFLGVSVSRSQPPRQWRPCGPSHAIGSADHWPVAAPQGFGACEEDGTEQAVLVRNLPG